MKKEQNKRSKRQPSPPDNWNITIPDVDRRTQLVTLGKRMGLQTLCRDVRFLKTRHIFFHQVRLRLSLLCALVRIYLQLL